MILNHIIGNEALLLCLFAKLQLKIKQICVVVDKKDNLTFADINMGTKKGKMTQFLKKGNDYSFSSKY